MSDEDSKRDAQHSDIQHSDDWPCTGLGWIPYICEDCGETFDRVKALGGHYQSGTNS